MILPDSLKQKSREIAYALHRIAYYIQRQELRSRLEALAFSLLEHTALASVDQDDQRAIQDVLKDIAALDVLVRIGHSLYQIEPMNSTILIEQLEFFNSAMRQFGNLDRKSESIESIFSKTSLPLHLKGDEKKDIKVKNQLNISEINTELDADLEKEEVEESVDDTDIKMRQSAITDLVKLTGEGNCRLKDVIAAFPDVSERTLRYDLQKLCDQGVIERVGSSGPGSFYHLKP